MTSTQEQAQEAAAAAKDKAGEAAQQARGRVRDQVDQRSTQAGERVSSQASDVRSIASALRDQGQDQPAKLADQAADRVDMIGTYLQDADADKILGDVEDLGRRQPMAVLFGGLALGFAASRFLKASSQERYTASASGTGYRPPSRPAPALPQSGATAGRSTPSNPPLGDRDAGTLGTTPPPPRTDAFTGTSTFPEPLGADTPADPLAPPRRRPAGGK